MRKNESILPLFSLLAIKRRVIIAGINTTTVVLEKKASPVKKPERRGKNRFVFLILRLRKRRLKSIRKKLEFWLR
ncbi:hypothetical protein ES703_02203 [subsurface metagenome]